MTAVGVVWAAWERLSRTVGDGSADQQVIENLKEESANLIETLQDEVSGGKDQIQEAYDFDSKVEQYLLKHHNVSMKSVPSKRIVPNISTLFTSGSSKTSQESKLLVSQQSSSGEHARTNPLTKKMSKFMSHGPKDSAGNLQLAESHQDAAQNEKKGPVYIRTGGGGKEQEKVCEPTGATKFLSGICNFTNKIVGMDADMNTSKGLLKGESQFIWIYGKQGVGKTTLARNLFDKSSEIDQFSGRAWAQVGEKFQARDVAAMILLQLSSLVISNEDIQTMATTELMEQLQNAQKEKKCLVVLDDVPSVKDWKTILPVIPLQPSTKVVITTSLKEKELENIPDSSQTKKLHRKPLKEDQSWELFVNQLSQEEQLVVKDQTEELKNIKKKIFTRCGGIPLAITVFGGLIRGEFGSLLLGDKKGELLKFLDSPPAGNISPESEVLAFSYKRLPYLLKSCFLYLGLFQDGQVIPVEKLYYMWMSEGFLKTEKVERSRMDTAEDYLKALVQRGLVMVHQEEDSGKLGKKIQSCKLHPLVRKHCVEEGQIEGFYRLEGRIQGSTEAVADKKTEKSSYTKRRIAIDVENLQQCLKSNDQHHIRALLLFMTAGNRGEPADLKDVKSAKFLDFDGVDFSSGKFPKNIDGLVSLRHLSFRGCQLQDFPQSLCEFKFLETLDLVVRISGKMTIANSLGKISSLVHLYLPLSFTTDQTGEKLKLDGLTELETLENFHAGVCDVEDLGCLAKLRLFKGIADGNDVRVEEMVNKMLSFAHDKNALCWSISLRNFESFSKARSDIVKNLLISGSLQSLEIEGHLGDLPSEDKKSSQQKPNEQYKSGDSQVGPPGEPTGNNGYNSGITNMIFNGSEFNEDPMSILGQFKHLRNLVLCNDAFDGKKMVCSKGSFPKLRSLKLSSLWSLEELSVEDEAMQCLTSLVIENCRKFKVKSSYFQKKIHSLRDIKIDMMAGK